MGKNKWLGSSIVALLTALTSTIGCYVIPISTETAPTSAAPGQQPQQVTVPKEAVPLPIIISFTASSSSITTGQSVTLSWETSGATSVAIDPAIGTVNSSGTRQANPTTTTTYTLTASNGIASVISSRTVMVTAALPPPDLVITNIWTTGKIVYYNVKNQGIGQSELSQAYLYVNGPHVATDYTQPLAAGQERIEAFEAYVAPFDLRYPIGFFPFPYLWNPAPPLWDIKVCVDAENALAESDESNNCMHQTWGPTWGNPPPYVK
jgi:hypothetical protein